MGTFDGQRVIVTGASSGIGLTIAKCFAREGATVCMVARDRAKLDNALAEVKAYGDRASAYACDISSAPMVAETAQRIISEVGVPNVLVNNAGGFTQKISWEAVSEELWRNAIDTNVMSILYCSREFSRAMINANIQGSIVNVGSSAGLRPKTGRIQYTLTKAAVHTATQVLALELAGHGIRVNAVAPGPTLTEKMQQRFNDPGQSATEAERISKIPLRRMGQTEEIANALMFLASEKASFITGVILPVDGGYTLGG